jgi:type VI secretion system protein ImpH
MADHARHPRPDLSHKATEPLAMGFFELLRRLETPEARFGRSGGASAEPARLGQRVRLSMAARDVAGFRPGSETRPPEVDVEVLGLLGPEGALPLHITRWIMARLSERWFAGEDDRATSDTAFLDFCNLLQHRMLALYWRAWGDARPEVQAEIGTGGRVQALTDALAGIGMPGMKAAPGAPGFAALVRRHATSLAQEVRGPERLAALISDLLGAPVGVVEFIGEWLALPEPLQTRLGRAHAALGRGAVAGGRSFQRQQRIELRIGPLGLAHYRKLIEDPTLRDELRRAILFATGRDIEVDVRLVLAAHAVPEPRLGRCQLARTTWVSPRRARDADDLRQRSFTRGERVAA